MSALRDIPEIAALDAARNLVRIPPETDVAITPRVRRLIDTAAFRRLARISQLGLVSLVYPAALHTRFEHSLGVYRLGQMFLRQLSHDARFAELVAPADAENFLVAALLHDLGHWPFCHPIEDLHLEGIPSHESFAERFLRDEEVATLLERDWSLEPDDVLTLLAGEPRTPAQRIVCSMLSGPIDIDKMDYLARDSLHAGVPYGRHFDQARLIGSLCLNGSGDGIAITEKGRTAAELMVFARYVMFSEVYWHHGVRAATAMLQRAFYALRDSMDPETLFTTTEAEFIQLLRKTAAGSSKETDESHGGAAALLEGLFGPRRVLYKRVAQYSFFENEALYQLLARRDYRWLVRCAGEFAAVVRRRRDIAIQPHEVIFDAPPVALEVQFAVDVYFPKQDCYRPLGEVSPVVRTLAQEQFDDYVKRVRLFVHPRLRETLGSESEIESLLHETLEAVQDEG